MIRPCDIDRTGAVWCYKPKTHKTEYRNRERRIYIGPRAKHILSTWLVRHSRATELRRKYGLEAIQTVLGHAQADVTQIYAERDFGRAKRIMREFG